MPVIPSILIVVLGLVYILRRQFALLPRWVLRHKKLVLSSLLLGLVITAMLYAFYVNLGHQENKYDELGYAMRCFDGRSDPVGFPLFIKESHLPFTIKDHYIESVTSCEDATKNLGTYDFGPGKKLSIFTKMWQFYANWAVFSVLILLVGSLIGRPKKRQRRGVESLRTQASMPSPVKKDPAGKLSKRLVIFPVAAGLLVSSLLYLTSVTLTIRDGSSYRYVGRNITCGKYNKQLGAGPVKLDVQSKGLVLSPSVITKQETCDHRLPQESLNKAQQMAILATTWQFYASWFVWYLVFVLGLCAFHTRFRLRTNELLRRSAARVANGSQKYLSISPFNTKLIFLTLIAALLVNIGPLAIHRTVHVLKPCMPNPPCQIQSCDYVEESWDTLKGFPLAYKKQIAFRHHIWNEACHPDRTSAGLFIANIVIVIGVAEVTYLLNRKIRKKRAHTRD